MTRIITVEEQREQGLRSPTPDLNYIAPYTNHDLTTAEQAVLSSSLTAAGTVVAHRQTSHLARSEETPITNALSSLIYSLAYSVAGAVITGGLLLLALNFIGGDAEIYFIFWFIAWGLCFLGALAYNRWQGLWFSTAGLDHHEIDSRERIAMHTIDKHIEMLERKWGLAKD
jgi:hypothetical protein